MYCWLFSGFIFWVLWQIPKTSAPCLLAPTTNTKLIYNILCHRRWPLPPTRKPLLPPHNMCKNAPFFLQHLRIFRVLYFDDLVMCTVFRMHASEFMFQNICCAFNITIYIIHYSCYVLIEVNDNAKTFCQKTEFPHVSQARGILKFICQVTMLYPWVWH